MAEIKVTYERIVPLGYFVTAKGKIKRGDYCQGCGARLKDPVSKKRGYGRRCWKQLPVKIVLEIPASNEGCVVS